MVSKKTKHIIFVRVGQKIRPLKHRLGKLRDAKRWSSGRIFLSHPRTHDGFS